LEEAVYLGKKEGTQNERYIYPAIFNYAEDGISVSFPDIEGCFSCADTDEEAVQMAEEALELHLYGMEHDGELRKTLNTLGANLCVITITTPCSIPKYQRESQYETVSNNRQVLYKSVPNQAQYGNS
jgi:predicted RNase H-like HicB family nuclease